MAALYPRWPTKAAPKPEYPFRHLENDGVWRLVPIEGAEAALRDARDTGGEAPFAEMGVELARREAHGLPGRQVFTHVNAIDLLGYQAANRRWWVFELKRGRPADRVVGQVSRYLGWIAEERRGQRETAVGAIIARSVDARLRYAVKANERLSLWEYDDALKVRRVS